MSTICLLYVSSYNAFIFQTYVLANLTLQTCSLAAKKIILQNERECRNIKTEKKHRNKIGMVLLQPPLPHNNPTQVIKNKSILPPKYTCTYMYIHVPFCVFQGSSCCLLFTLYCVIVYVRTLLLLTN